MKLLVLGGTLFLGRHVVEAALARGMEVTTFTRGRTNPCLFPEVESLVGDRDGDLAGLTGRRWDAVVDTSAYRPRHAATARLLRGAVGTYALVSTGSVYATFPAGGAREDTPTCPPAAEPEAPVTPETYGPLKVACEHAVLEALGNRALVIRAGLLVGPHDPTERFAYWVRRVAEGGEVLAPGDPDRHVQLLDARDLAEWLLTAVETGITGVYNASGPHDVMTMRDLLDECRAVSASDAKFVWAADTFLLGRGVKPWTDLPLWLPADAAALLSMDRRKAHTAGLRYRALAETVAAVLRVPLALPPAAMEGPPRPAAITRERERELLSAWHELARTSDQPARHHSGSGTA